MRPQNYVCVLVASSGITFISSLIFFPLELFHTQNHPALPKSLYLSSGNFVCSAEDIRSCMVDI